MGTSQFMRFQTTVLALGLGLGLLTCIPTLRSLTAQPYECQVAGKAYEVDTKASRVYVRVDPDGRGHAHGIVGQLSSGTIALGSTEKAGELVFDLTSFQADAAETRKYVGLEGTMSESTQQSVTKTMQGDKVLDVQQYPQATFQVTAAVVLDGQPAGGPGRYRFDGRMKLHGSERPVQFEARAEETRDQGPLQLRGRFVLRQTDYQIKPYSALFGAVRVKDELTIYGDLVLVPKR